LATLTHLTADFGQQLQQMLALKVNNVSSSGYTSLTSSKPIGLALYSSGQVASSYSKQKASPYRGHCLNLVTSLSYSENVTLPYNRLLASTSIIQMVK
jgi:hypothetical protein